MNSKAIAGNNSAYALGGSSSSLHTKLEYIAVDFKCYPLYMNFKAITGNTLSLQLEEKKVDMFYTELKHFGM